jgi:hypothetical protein
MKPAKKNMLKKIPSKSARRNWQPLRAVVHVQITPEMTAGNWVAINSSTQKKSQLLLP